jgi:thioredoxin-like negative regulator of GroEL
VNIATRLGAAAFALPLALLVGGCSSQEATAPASPAAESAVRQAEGLGRDWYRELNSDNYDTVIKNSRGMYIVLVRGSDCRPCNDMSRSISTIERIEPPIGFGIVNIDENFELPQRLGIRAVPTTLVYRDGALIGRQQGSMPSEKFVRWLESLEFGL